MNKHSDNHIVPYRLYIQVLAGLIVMTILSVAITKINLDTLTVFAAILLASIKSALVLTFFMHLKFDNKLLQILVISVFVLVALVLFITFLDYNFR
ncbi:cytochrome C oxidase subunit IV family protein [Carboxylicivirga mesophila]|uniref:Cytochrome C oxidase subunit IV family protein n=1 Tax=Carboxylicivirga mesophila TaxID=1166478 RepID=A0ABS5KE16_9BACT|nr:cytochrome C oxidase subunit IV family protein [Carboxylicivirga mesophila]MBS2212738.1 cytochrome C oxidase subunit IV family protein [Carboxylicivirga mesophila]